MESSFLAENLLKFVNNSNPTLLDIGCGTGEDAITFAKKDFDVTALDSSEYQIRKTQNLANINNVNLKTITIDIKDFNFEQKYDVIFSNLVFHFLSKEDLEKVIEKIKINTKNNSLNAISFLKNNSFFSMNIEELKSYYKDWKILFYQDSDNTICLIAQKLS